MFERYTEQARRVLFFARYEASELPGVSIETEHLLLGLLRETSVLTNRLFADAQITYDGVRGRIAVQGGERIPESIEIPFTEETKRVLYHALEESERLGHSYIGPEHLLLGLLREERSAAGSILISHGMRIESAREQIATILEQSPELSEPPAVHRAVRLVLIRQLVEELERVPAGSSEMRELVERIREALDALMRDDS